MDTLAPYETPSTIKLIVAEDIHVMLRRFVRQSVLLAVFSYMNML